MTLAMKRVTYLGSTNPVSALYCGGKRWEPGDVYEVTETEAKTAQQAAGHHFTIEDVESADSGGTND